MATVNLPPIVVETLTLTKSASISAEEISRVATAVDRAVTEANRAIDTALERVHEAEQRQLLVNSHNEECERLSSWRRPAGWMSHHSGTTAYRGYTKIGPDGRSHPHGEGQSRHPNVTYRCANFDLGAVRGLCVEGWADGSAMSGYLDDVEGFGDLRRNDCQTGCTYVGHWKRVGEWTSLQLGAIEYPDGSIYRGQCGRVEELQRVWPDGYGSWELAKHAVVVRCGFERGFAQGAAVIQVNGHSFGGHFDSGRLTGVVPA